MSHPTRAGLGSVNRLTDCFMEALTNTNPYGGWRVSERCDHVTRLSPLDWREGQQVTNEAGKTPRTARRAGSDKRPGKETHDGQHK